MRTNNKQEIIVVDCYDIDLEDIINNKIGYENVLDIKVTIGGNGTPYCLIIAKKTDQNKDIKRSNTF